MITARYASLIAFAQSRAFCPTGIGNGTDNSCSSAAPGVLSYDDLPRDLLDSHGVVYDPGKSPFTSLKKADSVSIDAPRRTMEVAKEVGIKNPSDIAVIGAATSAGARVTIESQSVLGRSLLKVRADSPLVPGDKSSGSARTLVTVTPDKVVHYDFFDVDPVGVQAVQGGKVSLSTVSASVMAIMAKSLEAAERNGMRTAKASSAGNGTGGRLSFGADGELHGYRLWPKFGFDGPIGEQSSKQFWAESKADPSMISGKAAERYQTTGRLNVQDVIATKKGEEWWNRNGRSIDLKLNFGDKSSDGYKRYKQMLEVGKKAAARLAKSGRSEVEFWEWASARSGIPSLGEFEQRAFCPTGEGGGVKNDCSSSGGGGGDQKPQSFPKGSQPLRDAVDSVAPAPEQVWDRSKGLAETPPPKQIDDIASEQSSHSGASLTPEAEASYKSLVDEIGRQYEALTAAGLKARAWRGEGEPYGDPPGSTKPNSNKMREEVAKTKEFSFFMTDKGFGTGDATPDHPMLRETKHKTADGEPMIANDLFRVVHDMVAHVRGGFSFSTNGEYNGMLTHASTLPEAAWPALFAETFGQNAVYEKTKQYAQQNAYASKIGPEIIRSELKKRTKSSRAAKDDGDEPLGYQHLKARPALLKSLVEERGFCPNGPGGGVTNDCSPKDSQPSSPKIQKPSWMGKTDASGSTKHGSWFLERNAKQHESPGHGDVTTHVVSLVGDEGQVKAFVHADLSDEKNDLYVNYAHVEEPYRRQGVYTSLLDSLSEKFRVTSDESHNVDAYAKKAYERLGARLDRYGHYVLEKKKKSEDRAFCPTGESRGDAPAPPKDRIKGSDVNDEGSAKNKSGDISLDERTISALKAKVEEHNSAMRERNKPEWTHVRLPALKAVYRRGAGAFSTSHRPGMTRDRWAMARVNAFLVLARRGRPENSKYVGDNDLLNANHPRYSTQSRSSDCGREDDGTFASGNKCGGQVDMPKEDPRGRLRYDNGVQTDAARKLYQMGSSEKKLKALVDVMGGDAKNTRVDINPPSLNISVADKDGNKLFHVDFENGRARLYPAKDLNPAEASKIEDAASEAFGGTQADTKIKVYRKADDMKKWQAENDAKIKKWEDKYKFSLLLPPHQRPKKWERSLDARYASLLAFAEARDCGQDKDGKFSKGNTCASGLAADVASGAAKGAAVGAVSGFSKTWTPQGTASGAAIGAAAGAVKGIYDNKMRPTRVSERMKSLGLEDKDIASIVTSLKGTPKSVATTTGNSRLTVRVKDKDGKTSHVIDFTKKTVTIYPRSGRKELSDKDLDSIKQIARDNSTKQTRFAVKTDSLSYAKRIARNGFEVAANKAGLLVATAVVSGVAPSVPDAVLGVADIVLDTHFTDSFYHAKRR